MSEINAEFSENQISAEILSPTIEASFSENTINAEITQNEVTASFSENAITATLYGHMATRWGSILGTLTNQTDLKNALDLKANLSALNIDNWNTAYSWGDHASEGYLTAETDPVFSSWLSLTPPLYSETDPVFSQWLLNTPPLYSETDPVYSASEAASFVAGDAAKLAGIEAGAQVNNTEYSTAAGQMLFGNGSGGYSHTETSELFWDDTEKRLIANSVAITDQFVNLSEPTLTYTGDLLTRIDYSNGKYKIFSYNVDETLASIDYNNEYMKTFTYTGGKLISIST